MKDGICPKCGEQEVYESNDDLHNVNLPVRIFSRTALRLYVCAACGYLEEYVQNAKDLSGVRESKSFKKIS
jgi:predicted nucleic-acid-binding Zn-ribbon protein